MTGYLMVDAGSTRVAVPAVAIERVMEPGAVRPAPSAHAALWGLIHYAGRDVLLLHLGTLLGNAQRPDHPTETAVMVRCGTGTVALAVEEADEVVRREAGRLPAGMALSWASGVVREGERVTPIVDMDVLAERLTRSETTR